jgi:uncharacterized circularly permuted ATP-grasp superfamily protein
VSELGRAIDTYHSTLTPELAEASASWLDARLAERGLRFGARPLCTVLRPRFLTVDAYATIQRAGAAIARAFVRAHAAAMERPEVLARFHLVDWELDLIGGRSGGQKGGGWPSPLGRYDAFFSEDGKGLKFTENNAETPAGSAYGDVLGEFFLTLPAMRPFLASHDVRFLPSRPSVLQTLLACSEARPSRGGTPTIGILDWREVPTQSEFEAFATWFRSLGFPAVIADPRELELRDGRLWSTGPHPMAIDLIYKRVLLHELVAREGLDTPMIRAVREGAAVMVNPFECKVLHKKASLAVLSDERNEGLFDTAMRAAITACIPWTRVVEDRRTTWQGKDASLLEIAARHRDRFVLKPNDDYGGAGIVLGWEVDDATWDAALQLALAAPTVIQERIHQPSEPYPSWVDGQLDISDRIVDTAPYVFQGSYVDGCLSRISTAALVNVTAGGGSTVPTLVVEQRA